jgi:hypothetical protein
MLDEIKLNVNPSTLQKLARAPELKDHGVAPDIETESPLLTVPTNEPEGLAATVLSQAVAAVAVFAVVVFKSTAPLNPMLPVIGVAWAMPATQTTAKAAAILLIHLFFIFLFLLIVYV